LVVFGKGKLGFCERFGLKGFKMRNIFSTIGKTSGRTVLMGLACLFFVAALMGQAPPGPLTPPPPSANTTDAPPPAKTVQVKPRKNIYGSWKFNKDDSDDPHQKSRESRDTGNSGSHGGMGGPRIGFPGGTIGGGGMGGPRGGSQGESSEDRARAEDLYNPAYTLTLSQKFDKDPEVDLTDDRDRQRVYFTDGRKIEKSKNENYEQVAARWDDNKLVTDEKGSHNSKLTRTFEVSPDGLQLWETIHVEPAKNKTPITVRYVYDAVDSVRRQ
jgi:hypothetical protein